MSFTVDLTPFQIAIGDTLALESKLNGALNAVQNAVNAAGLGVLNVLGFHDASTGSYPSTPSVNDAWIISVAGTISGTEYEAGDLIAYTGTQWVRVIRSFDPASPPPIGDVAPKAGVFTNLPGANLLINPAGQVWQRGETFESATVNGRYTLDRWKQFRFSGMTTDCFCERRSGKWARLGRRAGSTNEFSTSLIQRIEADSGFPVLPYAGQQVTLSFTARNDGTTDIRPFICTAEGSSYGALANSGVFSGGATNPSNQDGGFITPTASAQRYSFTATVPAGATQILVSLRVGSNFTGTASADEWVEITDVMLEVSAVASTFRPRPIAQELALCQRYYQKSYNQGVFPGASSALGAPWVIGTTTSVATGFRFFPMRTIPTVTLYSTGGAASKISGFNSGSDVGTTVTAGNLSNSGALAISDSGTAFTDGARYRFHYVLNAEIV